MLFISETNPHFRTEMKELLESPLQFVQANADKLIKFFLVGLSSFFVDMGLTYLAKEKLKLNNYAANTVGFVLSSAYNFTLNRMWTFQNHDDEIGIQLLKYFGVMVVALAISNTIIYLLTEKAKLNFYFSKLSAIAVMMVWTFTANNLFTFKH